MPTIFSRSTQRQTPEPQTTEPAFSSPAVPLDAATPQPEAQISSDPGKHAFVSRASMESPYFPTWCPGCGNFGIWTAFKNALVELEIPEEKLVIVYGVGCNGNMADFNRVYGFHALHGRAIPNAVAIKLANHRLKVVIVSGDGDTYGEGLNHLISAMRGNHDVTMLVHDNQIYGLTTGQTSPTTEKGTKTKSTPAGAPETPVNPLGLALNSDATFIARGFAGNIKHLTQLIKAAILHPGFSLVDMFQPCFTFNKVNTYHYFKEKIYNLQDQGFQTNNKVLAWEKTFEHDKLPIGIFYADPHSTPFHATLAQLQSGPLVHQSIEQVQMNKALKGYS